jgi:hypothetical protein
MDSIWLNRAPAKLPEHSMKTYALSAPIATHRRAASCAEVACERQARGWRTALDVSVPEHAAAANWIRLHSGLRFTVEQVGDAVTFTFPAGQQCFDGLNRRHTAPLEREPFYIVRAGDWRTSWHDRQATARLMHVADWLDDFANHQQQVADAHSAG